MIAEDYISRAAKNWLDFNLMKFKYNEVCDELQKAKETIEEKEKAIGSLETTIRQLQMEVEEFYCKYAYSTQESQNVSNLLGLIRQKCENLES